MVIKPIHRMIIRGLLAAIPLEIAAASMLPYVPRIGVPPNPNSWLRLAGDVCALIHAPGLLLSDFLCVKYCLSRRALLPVEILGGYLDLLLIILVVFGLLRSIASPLEGPPYNSV